MGPSKAQHNLRSTNSQVAPEMLMALEDDRVSSIGIFVRVFQGGQTPTRCHLIFEEVSTPKSRGHVWVKENILQQLWNFRSKIARWIKSQVTIISQN